MTDINSTCGLYGHLAYPEGATRCFRCHVKLDEDEEALV